MTDNEVLVAILERLQSIEKRTRKEIITIWVTEYQQKTAPEDIDSRASAYILNNPLF